MYDPERGPMYELAPARTILPAATMLDCTGANVGDVLETRFARQPAQGYVTGGPPVEWAPIEFDMFPRKMRTAQSADFVADDGSPARELDVERWAALPEHWPAFYRTRADKDRATCYCSLTTVPAVLDVCRLDRIPPPPRWRLAWWWKNTNGPLPIDVDVPAPLPSEVLAELLRLTGVELDPARLWACQYADYDLLDLSVIYGPFDLARH